MQNRYDFSISQHSPNKIVFSDFRKSRLFHFSHLNFIHYVINHIISLNWIDSMDIPIVQENRISRRLPVLASVQYESIQFNNKYFASGISIITIYINCTRPSFHKPHYTLKHVIYLQGRKLSVSKQLVDVLMSKIDISNIIMSKLFSTSRTFT